MSLFVDTSAGVDQGSVTTDLFSISWNDGNLGQGADTTVSGGLNGITSIPVAPVTYPSVTTGKDTANRLLTLVNNTGAANGLNWADPIVITALPGGNDPYLGNSIDGNGQTYVDTNVTPNVIHVVYDTSQDGGKGIALFDKNGNAIQSPNCVILYHELSHAFHNAINQIPFPQTDCPGNTSDEPAAEKDENVMRTELGLCLRDVCNHGGESGWGKACGGSAFPGGPPLVDGNAPPDNGGCFVVTAAAGTPYALEIWRLRAIRDALAERSQLAGRLIAAIYEEYAGFGPTLAEAIAFDPEARAKVRALVVRPLFAWYDLAHVLASGPAPGPRLDAARQALREACEPALAPWLVMLLERALRREPLPGLVAPDSETARLARAAAERPLAAWALLEALAAAWRCAAGRADPVEAVSRWLAHAPLDRLPEPAAEWMDVELSGLARLLDFAPEARLAQALRLEAAWPRASAALKRHGLVRADTDHQ